MLTTVAPYIEAYKMKTHKPQKKLVAMMLFMAMATFAIFSIFHLLHGMLFLGTIQFFLAVLYYVCLSNKSGSIPYSFKEAVLVIGMSILVLILLATGGIANTGVYWVPLLPFLVISMKGVHKGLFWLLAFVFCGVLLQVLKAYDIFSTPYTLEQVSYLLSAFSIFTVLAVIFQLAHVRDQFSLETKNHKLQQMRSALNETLVLLEDEISKQTSQLKESNKLLQQEVAQHQETNDALLLTEQKFFQAQKMDAMGTLVGGIAHDFTNTLSGITAHLFLIQREIKGQVLVQEKLDNVERLVFNAAEMTRQLLTFARKDKINKKLFNVNSFMKEALKLAVVALPSRIKLDKNLSDTPLNVVGSAVQLQQVLMNLLNNARDAVSTVDKPIIKINMRAFSDAKAMRKHHPNLQGEWLYFSIEDNGIGILPENLSHVFEPFFTTKPSGKGTGLGLAMCFGSIQSHAGVIEIDSELGKGSICHIYLPLSISDPVVSNKNTLQRKEVKGETILLVDDEEVLRVTQCNVLEKLGYQVIEARNGLEAIKAYADQGEDIDLVIMDIMMPEMNGIQAAQHILTMDKKAKLFFSTGYYDHESSVNNLFKKEVVDLAHIKRLNKPFTIEQLCNMIDSQII